MPDTAVLHLVGHLQAAGVNVKSRVTSHLYGEGLASGPPCVPGLAMIKKML